MKKALKWLGIGVVALGVLVIAAVIVIPLFVDINQYKPLLEKRVSEATGRPFTIGGDLDLSIFPFVGVQFSDLRLGSRKGFGEKDFIHIKDFEARVKLLPLLSKEIEVKRFVVKEPRILLVKDKRGEANWQFGKTPQADLKTEDRKNGVSGEISIKRLDVEEFTVTDGILIYVDQSVGSKKELSNLNIKLKDLSFDRPVGVTFSARLDEKPLDLEGIIGPMGSEPGKGTIPVDFTLKALGELVVALKGKVTDPAAKPKYDLAVTISEFSPRKLSAAFGQKLPIETKDAKALARMSLSVSARGGLDSIAVSEGLLILDDSKLAFSADAKSFEKPVVTFKADMDRIDLDRYLSPAADGKEKPPAQESPSERREKADYSPLRRMVADGTLQVGYLKAKNAEMQDIRLQMTAKDGIVRLDPLTAKLYSGEIRVNGSLDVRKESPQSTLDFSAKTIQAGPLLKAAAGLDIIEGAANARLAIRFSGDEAEQIKKSLNGTGEIVFADGAIVGVDIPGMVRNVKAAFGLEEASKERPRTDFSELKVPIAISDGILQTTEAVMQSPLLRLTASGKADLVKETLDFRLEPRLVATLKGQGDIEQRKGIMVPVLVTGTFSSPAFRPDIRGIAEKQLKEKVLESKEAKELLQREELDKIPKGAKDALKGLLGQ
ncbi:MAG: AsmA family protein [Desulfobacteraceae bacterium]|nr:MAG: AsmA family protein [Desulfobacteraceae bacterium]